MLKKYVPKSLKESIDKKLAENAAKGYPVSEDKIIKEEFTKKCKTPCLKEWAEFQTRLPTEQEVCEWFDLNPEANIAIVTGRISNLVVFDLDSEDAVDYANKRGGFPNTPKAKTGKGYHLYMQHPGFDVRNKVNSNLKIDIRADGGYVAAPPSIHFSGHQYSWEEGLSIFDINPAPCGQWMTCPPCY